jgi:hypothetical protein
VVLEMLECKCRVETSVEWFSLFQWEPSRSSFRFSERELEVFPHRDDMPVRFLPLETDFLKTSECISWIFFWRGIKTCAHQFSGCFAVFSANSGKHGTSTIKFGRKPGDIKEKPPKMYIGLQLGVKL